jgi:hypothetical protein
MLIFRINSNNLNSRFIATIYSKIESLIKNKFIIQELCGNNVETIEIRYRLRKFLSLLILIALISNSSLSSYSELSLVFIGTHCSIAIIE